MRDLSKRFAQYRQCLMDIWNKYFSELGDWDDRVYFSNASLELFRSLVLYDCDDRDRPLLPSYRGDQRPIESIRLTVEGPLDRVRISADPTFASSREVLRDQDLSSAELAFVDLWDSYPLGERKFEFACGEVVRSGGGFGVGERVLIPFEFARFFHLDGLATSTDGDVKASHSRG